MSGVVAVAAGVGMSVVFIPPAHAEVSYSSYSQAVFLDGKVLAIDSDAIAGIDGASATYIDGTTSGDSDEDDAPLDVTTLNALNLALPGLSNLTVGDLLALGVVNQNAEALPAGVSNSQTDTTGLSLDLLQLLDSTPVLSQASLDLGAVESSASVNASDPSSLTRDTTIADADLDLTSPTVAGISTTATDATGTLVGTLDGLGTPIQSGVDDSIGTILEALGGITGEPSTETTVGVDASRLNTAIQGVLNTPLSTDLVTLDPASGTITVNLADGIDLNDIPPNSTLLSPEVMQSVSADVATLLDQLQANLTYVLNHATDYVDLTLNSDTTITAPITGTTLGTMNLSYEGTLGDFLDGATIDVSATGDLALAEALGTLSSIVETAVGTAVNTTITTAVSTAGDTVNTAVTDATNALSPVLTGLADVVAVNLNVQNDGDGLGSAAAVTAVQVTLLGDETDINLATSSVGPNAANTYNPTLAATDTAAGGNTTVTGDGWPPNTDVSLQLLDPDGNSIGDPITAATDANGDIEPGTMIEVPASSAPGTYSVSGTTASDETADAPFQVTDETAPEAPAITTPANGSTTADTTPTISGTAEPNSTVTVSMDGAGNVIGTTTAGPGGNWSLDTPAPLGDGSHTVSATATDAAGNASGRTSNTFTVDTVAPDAPAITTPGDGSTTADTTPTISGTAEPNSTVTVSMDGAGNVIGTTTAGPGGNWSLDTPAPLGDGSHTVSATATDAAGNVSGRTSNTFTVDTVAPDAPAITTPGDGSTTADTTPTITGTGVAGSTVTVLDKDGNAIGNPVVVEENGTWSVTPDSPLAEGTYTITATQDDPAGNTSLPSAPVTFTVDTTAPAAPRVTGPADGSTIADTTPTITGQGEPGATVTVMVDNEVIGTAKVGPNGTWTLEVPDNNALTDGDHTVTATQTDPAGNESAESNTNGFVIDNAAAAPVITAPKSGTSTNDTTPTITGTGDPDATLTVRDQDGVIGTTTVNPDGSWSLTPDPALTDGTYTVIATQKEGEDNESAQSNAVILTVDTQEPTAPSITAPANDSTTTNNKPAINGTGEPGDTVTVTRANGNTVGTAEVGSGGTWTLVPGSPLADGTYTIGATQTDPAGNTSDASPSVTFTVDTTAAPPVITSPADGSATADTTPTIKGTGEPGATVQVTVDGKVIGTATVGDDGTWSYDTPASLDERDHTVSATQTDKVGNKSSDSKLVTFTVDTAAPKPPVITSPTKNSTTEDTTPTISGTGQPGATVQVTVDKTIVGKATVNSNGKWSLVVPNAKALKVGKHTATATQTDPAGNTSLASAPDTFTVKAPVTATTRSDTAKTTAGKAVAVKVLANDKLPKGSKLSSVTGAHGTWKVKGNQVVFTPAKGYHGAARGTYRVRTPQGTVVTGTVTVSVKKVYIHRAYSVIEGKLHRYVYRTTDPNWAKEDADHDGLSNGREAAGWTAYVTEHGAWWAGSSRWHVSSNPYKADADRDGSRDLAEYRRRTDPRDYSTDGQQHRHPRTETALTYAKGAHQGSSDGADRRPHDPRFD